MHISDKQKNIPFSQGPGGWLVSGQWKDVGPIEINFRAFQNLVTEHSVEGVQASLYNLTNSVPDPLNTPAHQC